MLPDKIPPILACSWKRQVLLSPQNFISLVIIAPLCIGGPPLFLWLVFSQSNDSFWRLKPLYIKYGHVFVIFPFACLWRNVGGQNGVRDGAMIYIVWGRGGYCGGRRAGQVRGRDSRQLQVVAPLGPFSILSGVVNNINNPPSYKSCCSMPDQSQEKQQPLKI